MAIFWFLIAASIVVAVLLIRRIDQREVGTSNVPTFITSRLIYIVAVHAFWRPGDGRFWRNTSLIAPTRTQIVLFVPCDHWA
ncbi:MAG: hypothetical protein ACR2JB_25025 [Bryobacteraceae bacterium]